LLDFIGDKEFEGFSLGFLALNRYCEKVDYLLSWPYETHLVNWRRL
jgi:hypothetical protein